MKDLSLDLNMVLEKINSMNLHCGYQCVSRDAAENIKVRSYKQNIIF